MYDHIEGRFVYGDDVYVDEYYFDEVWEYIQGFPGYMVSNKGRIWSEKTQKFLKPKPMDNHGHLGVSLHQNGVCHYRYIHRLVAEAFIPNPDNLPVVRHIYDEPSYNEVDDLAWGTQRDNAYDAIRNGKSHIFTAEDREKWLCRQRRPVEAVDLNSGKTLIFDGQTEAARVLGIHQANIWKVLNGERRHAEGYSFRYLDKEGSNERDH